jgi:uncharacterized membrane protein
MIVIHIAAGLLSLLAGFVALYATKGSPLHRRAGVVFAIAMLTMTSSAVIMAAFLRPNHMNAVAGAITLYLVATGWLTVRRSVQQMRGITLLFAAIGLIAASYAFAFGMDLLAGSQRIFALPLFLFATIAALGVFGDLHMLRAGVLQGTRRLARHLWRMTFALWIATMSFFLGQAKVMPEPLRGAFALRSIPVLLVLIALVYWLIRVRMKRQPLSLSRTTPPAAGHVSGA